MRTSRPILRARIALTLSLLAPHFAAPGSAGAPPIATWFEPDGSSRWSAAVPPVPATNPTVLTTRRWFPPLPDLEIELVDGGRFRSTEAHGSVLLIDFWASWCAPCRDELPHLVRLYEASRDEGLKAIAVNVGEERRVVADAARHLKLSMPVGIYHDGLSPALYRKPLPTIVLVDRFGFIRKRWDGYERGEETEIAGAARALLAESEPPRREVATVHEGAGRLGVVWMRDLLYDLAAVAPARVAGQPGVLVSLSRGLTFYGSDGSAVREWPAQRSHGTIRTLVGPGPEDSLVVAFRPGGPGLETIALTEDTREPRSTAGPVLDVALLPGPAVAAATTSGVEIHAFAGGAPRAVDGIASARALAPHGSPGEARLAALGRDGRVVRLGSAREVLGAAPAPAGAAALVADAAADPGFAALASTVRAAAVGRYLEGAAGQLALALGDELLILDLADGTTLFRARWPAIESLGACDLDGDGRAELAVGRKRDLTLLAAGGAR